LARYRLPKQSNLSHTLSLSFFLNEL